MKCSVIYNMGDVHMVNIPQTLIPGVGNDPENKRLIYCNKTINWIINYFPDAHIDVLLKESYQKYKASILKVHLIDLWFIIYEL